jgi:hypothetical protein
VEGGVDVCVGGAGVSVGLAQAAKMATENMIYNIGQNGLRITIPPFYLGISKIIHLPNTISLL